MPWKCGSSYEQFLLTRSWFRSFPLRPPAPAHHPTLLLRVYLANTVTGLGTYAIRLGASDGCSGAYEGAQQSLAGA